MSSEERINLIHFLAEYGINAYTFTDAEIRQKAQKIMSTHKLKKEVKTKPGKKNLLAIKKSRPNT